MTHENMLLRPLPLLSRAQRIELPHIPVVELADWTLRGISQVVFQNNLITGLVILGAIAYNSGAYATSCVLGTVVATLTAVLLRADRGQIRAGLFGYNGALLGIGLNAYLSADFTAGQYPDWRLYLFIVFGAAFTTVVMSALFSTLGLDKVPGLTAPFVLVGWLFIFAVWRFSQFHPGPLLAPALPAHFTAAQHYTWTTWYQGTGKGVGEIFLQDNWITGYAILFGIFLNTRIGAFMCLLASVLGVGIGIVLGAAERTVQLGLFGFSACLTAIALGGFFFVLNWRGFIYAVFGILVSIWAWATVNVVLSPIGMPTFTSPFVIVTALMLFAKDDFAGLVPVAPADATTPEENYLRWSRSRQSRP
jgi:urea transporter